MYSVYKRQRILHYERTGHKAPTICRMLREEGMGVSRVGVHKFLQKYKETRSIERRPIPIVFRSNYSRIVLRTVAQYYRSFPYNGRERSVLPAFSKNETLTLYCHILYVCMCCMSYQTSHLTLQNDKALFLNGPRLCWHSRLHE